MGIGMDTLQTSMLHEMQIRHRLTGAYQDAGLTLASFAGPTRQRPYLESLFLTLMQWPCPDPKDFLAMQTEDLQYLHAEATCRRRRL